MSIKTLVTNFITKVACLVADLSSDGVTDGEVIDTADYEMDLTISVLSTASDGTVNLIVEDSDDGVDFDNVSGEKLVFQTEYATPDDGLIVPETPLGGNMHEVGVFGTRRYVRASIGADSVSAGSARAFMRLGGEIIPAEVRAGQAADTSGSVVP